MGRVADWQILVGRAASAITQRRGNASALGHSDETAVGATDGLLFLGNPHETVPRALLLDRRLGAVEVLGWQMIRLLSNADRTTAFPTYDQLQPLLRSGVGKSASRGTVARVIAVLRLTRWLSLCHRARNETNGRVIGNVYVLHDEPVTPSEAQMLDADYLSFVAQSCRHASRAVREVAEQIRSELSEDGMTLSAPLDRLDRRAARFEELQPSSPGELRQFSKAAPQFSTRTKSKINELASSSPRELRQFASTPTPSSPRELSPKSDTYGLVRDENSVPTTVVRSYINTCTSTRAPVSEPSELFWSDLLELGPDDREAISHDLASLPADLQQAVLDETAGRVAAGRGDNPRGLLHGLIKRAREGQFRTTRYAQQQAARRGERYSAPESAPQPVHAPPASPAAALGSSSGPGPARRLSEPSEPEAGVVSRADGQAARQQLLASLGIRR